MEGKTSGVVLGDGPQSNQNRPEVSVFPDLNHQDLFRVVVAAANNVYYYQVTPEHVRHFCLETFKKPLKKE